MHECGLIVIAAVEAFGGDQGIDALASARIFEILMTTGDWNKLTKVRELLCKTRSQTLKEQEFLAKTGQLNPPGGQDGGDGEDAESDAEAISVVDSIKRIFGISPDPKPEPPSPEVPAASAI
jgi:hypothetical protein